MAVYTKLSDREVASFLQQYDLGPVRGREPLSGGVTNSNWRIDFAGDPAAAVLTVIEPETGAAELDFVFGFQHHLAAHGIPLAAPIAQKSGAFYGQLAGKPAVLTGFLSGDWPREPNAAQAAAVGTLLGRMHLAVSDFALRRSNPMGLPDMAAMVRELDPLAIETAVPGLAADLAGAFRETLEHWPQGLPAGAVHADLFPDNVLFDGDRISGAIDFYYACTAPFAADLAMAHAAWCFSEGESAFLADRSQALLQAYEAVRPLSPAERDALPLLARAACLRILATRLRDWIAPVEGASVTAKHPGEFAARLRFYSTDDGARAFAP